MKMRGVAFDRLRFSSLRTLSEAFELLHRQTAVSLPETLRAMFGAMKGYRVRARLKTVHKSGHEALFSAHRIKSFTVDVRFKSHDVGIAEFGEIAVQEAINGLVFGPRTLLRHSVNRDFLTDNLTGVFPDTDLLTLVIYKPFETLLEQHSRYRLPLSHGHLAFGDTFRLRIPTAMNHQRRLMSMMCSVDLTDIN